MNSLRRTLLAAALVVPCAFAASAQGAAKSPPVSTSRPVVSGTARAGEQLSATSGGWTNLPTAFKFKWLSCPPSATPGDVTGCTEVAGASGPTHVIAPAEVGRRAVVEVTAENSYGQETALSAPTAAIVEAGAEAPREEPVADTTAPVLSKLSLSRLRFHLGGANGRRASAGGTVLHFTSSEAATLSVAILRAKQAKALTVVHRAIGSGHGQLALSGRVGRRPLAPGRYRLSVTATDAAGNVSKPSSLSFAVLGH